MTTLTRSRRNDNVLIGFFALVCVGIAIRTAFAENFVLTVIFAVVAVGLVGLAIWLRSQPSLELRIAADEIVLASPKRQLGRIARDETGGRVVVAGWIRKGRLYMFLTRPGDAAHTGLGLEGFDPDRVADACTSHGWAVERSQ